ncbi:helix-turn-helix protein [Thermosporothrix hazakensis]|uniref:Helix-turn-helix protein n=2 Tax=Thermosporothrix TaxID=768650 RepID=A0A326TYV5_THEHA|nr:helix-turn-helix domain-containing protein [Thermosporothrix hazakensis]PZW22535.1 helix-turn-helix protein [Thermosporothrix hazakensis]BBH87793.1 hypothetical protein KTC_25440 [Thermosporothrix sp. COM3]GCE50223.1 hypothetical protein KTH_50920 [Thermosporothrix hazakensis]
MVVSPEDGFQCQIRAGNEIEDFKRKFEELYETGFLLEGFTSVPILAQRWYRYVPGKPLYDREGNRLSEESFLTPTEFALLLTLYSYLEEEQIQPSVSTLAMHLGKSNRQVRRYIARMSQKGFLHVTPQYGPDQQQLANYYDLSPFFQRLYAFLESFGHKKPRKQRKKKQK